MNISCSSSPNKFAGQVAWLYQQRRNCDYQLAIEVPVMCKSMPEEFPEGFVEVFVFLTALRAIFPREERTAVKTVLFRMRCYLFLGGLMNFTMRIFFLHGCNGSIR